MSTQSAEVGTKPLLTSAALNYLTDLSKVFSAAADFSISTLVVTGLRHHHQTPQMTTDQPERHQRSGNESVSE